MIPKYRNETPVQIRSRFAAVAAHYDAMRQDLERTPRDRWAADPYAWCDVIRMTPIEESLWTDIRAEGVVLYPQFPVGRFFVDYGNPAAKVAIECDGKEFHVDKAKDAARQAEIESMGWKVYRLTGAACKMTDTYDEDEFGVERLMPSPARSLIRLVADRHMIAIR